MRKYNIIGEHSWCIFKSLNDGSIIHEPISLDKYDGLSLPNPINPTKEGYVFIGASKGYKVDSDDGFLSSDSYWIEGDKIIYRDKKGKYGRTDKYSFEDALSKNKKIIGNF